MDFNLDDSLSNVDLNATLDAKTSPIDPPTKTVSGPLPMYKKFSNPIAQSDVLRTPDDTGSKYDVGFINQLNLENYRAENQSGGAQLVAGLGRLAGGAVLDVAKGISTLASAVGVGAADALIGTTNAFSPEDKQSKLASLDDITDNPVNNLFYGLDDWWKKTLPVYKPTDYNDKNLIQQMGSTAWWADEGADVGAFMLSNLLPSAWIGDAALGAKATTALDGLGVFDKATKIATDVGKMGKLGDLASTTLLSKSGLINPVKFATTLDHLAQESYMTTSEAFFMSRDAGEAVKNNYLQSKNKQSEEELTPEETKELTDKKALAEKHTFWANMAALSFSSKVETGFVNKIFGHAGAESAAGLVDIGENLASDATAIPQTGVQKFLSSKAGSYAKNIPKYALLEGAYKANIQNSISAISTQFGYQGVGDYLAKVAKLAVNNLGDADAYKAMGANLVLGTFMGAYGGMKEAGEQAHTISNTVNNVNQAKENFINLNNVLYQKDADGNVVADENGPKYNVPAIVDYAKNTLMISDLTDIHDEFKNRGDEAGAKLVKDEAFTKYALAHLEAGLGDELIAKVKALSSYKDEDLAAKGFDPIEIGEDGNKISVAQKAQELLKEATQIQKDYNQVSKTVGYENYYNTGNKTNDSISNTNLQNARTNEAVKNLSRIRSLDDLIQDSQHKVVDLQAKQTDVNPLVESINIQARQLDAQKEAFARGLELGNIQPESRKANELASQMHDLEESIQQQKEASRIELEKIGYQVNPDALELTDEKPESPDVTAIKGHLQDIEDSKIAKLGLQDRYNDITSYSKGAENFVNGIASKTEADINNVNQAKDEQDTTDQKLADYKEGDFVSYGDNKGYLTPNDKGELSVNGQLLSKAFLDQNPDLHKYSTEELQSYKDKQLKDFRKQQLQDRIDKVQKRIDSILSKDSEKQEQILNHLISIDDIVANKQTGIGRMSERKLARQVSSIQDTINQLGQEREELLDQVDNLQSKIENIKDDQVNGDINDNYEQLDTYNKDIDNINKSIQENDNWISKLKDALKTFQNLWKSFFPNKVLNLEKGRQDYTDAKAEIKLTKEQIQDLEQTNADLLGIKNGLLSRIKFLEDEIKDYELESNKLEYNPAAKPDTTTTTTVDNPPTVNSSPIPAIEGQGLFKTAGANSKEGQLNERLSQRIWGKFAEEFNPKNPESYSLRTVTLDDPEYGLNGSKEDLYKEEDKQYQHKDNIKVLVVDKEGNLIYKSGSKVYTSLPEITDSKTEPEHFTNFRFDDKALAKQAIEDYREFANLIKNSKEPLKLEITGKSNGRIVIGEPISAKEAFGENLPLQIITDDKTTIGGNDYPLPKGLVYVNYNGRPVGAETHTLTPEESKAVLYKLKEYAKLRGDENATNNGELLNQIKSTILLNQRNTNPDLSIYFVKGDNTLVFGDKSIYTADLIDGKYDTQLREFLDNQNLQVDKSTLDKNQPYTDIFDKKWNSYQDYLLTSRDNPQDTPLTFKIQPKLDDIDKPQFLNTYLTYSKPKNEVEEVKSQEQASKTQATAFEFGTSVPFISLSSILDTPKQSIIEQISPSEEVVKEISKELKEDNTNIQDNLLDEFYLKKDFIDNWDYKPIDFDKEEKWFKENISSTLPFEKVKGLIDKQAYGKFVSSGQVLVSDLATGGTAYHEAFHVVSQLYLTDKEREGLYNQWRKNNIPNSLSIKFELDIDNRGEVQILDSKGELKGALSFFPSNTYPGWADISGLDVNPEMRGNKLQDVLYQKAIGEAKKLGYKGILSGISLLKPEITKETHTRFNREKLSSTTTDGVDHDISGLTSHKNESVVEDFLKNYKNYSDRQVEEKLAEEFREYQLTKQSPYKTFFDKIISFIRSLLGIGNSDRDTLFAKISTGQFLDSKIKSNSSLDLYKMSDHFDANTTKDLMDSMTFTLVRGLFKNNFSLNDIDRFNNKLLNQEDSSRFANIYQSVLKTINKAMLEASSKQSNGELLKNMVDYINQNKASIQEDHIKYLTKYGINLEVEPDTQFPEDYQRAKDTLGIISAIEFSTKSGMPNVIKLMIASLPKLSLVNGQTKAELNNLGLPKLSDYRRNTAILTNELANMSSFKEQMYKIKQLSLRVPEFSLLADQLGVNEGTNPTPSTLRSDYFDLQSKFRQQFDKAYYSFYTQLYDGNNSHLVDSNSDRLTSTIRTRWQGDAFKNLNTYKTVNGQYILDAEYFKKNYDKALKGEDKRKSTLSFYKDLGITFSQPNLVDIDILADKQKALINKMQDNEISSIFQDEAESKGFVNSILEQEIKSSLDYSDNQHINPESKTVYNVSLHNYLSRLTAEINNFGFPKELQWDEETQTGNPLLRHSAWSDKINNGKQLSIGILEGARINAQGEDGTSTSDLSYPDAASQQFTSVLEGKYPFMRAGDKALEHIISLGDKPSFVGLEEATEYFRGHLADELLSSYMLNVEGIGSEYPEYANSAKDLRVFKDAIGGDYQTIIKDKTIDRKEAINRIETFTQKDETKASIQKWFDKYVQENKQLLLDNNLVSKVGDTYTLLGIPTELADKFVGKSDQLSEGQMNSLVEQFTFNQLQGNIEQTKLLTGDVAFYKDFFKRTSGLTGTGKTTWVGSDIDAWLNENRKREYKDYSGKIKVDKKSDSKIQTLVFKDVKAVSSNFDSYLAKLVENGLDKNYATKLLDGYNKAYEEGDAQGYITLPEYREFLTRTGDWTASHEALYPKLIREEEISKEDLGNFLSGFPVLKPQYFGSQADNELFVPTFYKFSVMPLIPNVIKGTELEELMHTMLENGNGISLFQSGNKVGGKVGNDLYDSEGKINLDTNNLTQQEVGYENLKIQLDMNPSNKNKVIFGTQFRKLVLANLAGKDITIGGKLRKGDSLIKTYSDLIDKTVQLETQHLVNKLGLKQVDENTFRLENPSYLRELLQDEAFKRQAPDNLLEGINQVLKDGDTKQFDILVNRNRIENILMSLVNNSVIKQKTFGDMRVQAASTGFEAKSGLKGRSFEDAEKSTWWSKVEGDTSSLSFYKADPSGTQPMEVLLPHYFKELIGKNVDINKLDERLTKVLGYRTPTQGLNSMELMKIKGFLPQEAGNMIVVPSEIVVKSGSDFDIDKLSLHFPNYEMVDGEPKYLEYNKETTSNSLPHIYNRINDLAWKTIAAPENFRQLITPNSNGQLEIIANEVAKIKEQTKSITDNGKGNNIGWKKNLDIRQAYLSGKEGIGIAAIHNTNHVLNQIVGLKAKDSVKINLEHNDTNGQVDFSKEREFGADPTNSPTILDNLGSFLNGLVDMAKNPFLSTINTTMDTLPVYLYLVKAGVPLRQAIMFMNQPSIVDYIRESNRNDSLGLKATDNKLGEEALLNKILDKYPIKQARLDLSNQQVLDNYKKTITTKKLEDYIKGEPNNIVQQQILLDYLTYKEQAGGLSDLIKATTADTRGTGSTMNSAQNVIDSFDNLKKNSIFENVEKYLDETFIGSFHKAVEKSTKMYKPVFYTEKNEVKNELGRIKEVFGLNKFADSEKGMNLAKNDIINFALQTAPLDSFTIKNVAREMFTGSNSMAKELARAKEDNRLKNNLLIRELFPLVSSNSTDEAPTSKDLDNIKMFSKKLEVADSNLITEGWKELFNLQPQLAQNLVIYTMMQSGLNNSPVSFTQYIPNEYYVPLVSRLLSNEVDFKGFYDKFMRNNYQNEDLVPSTKKFINGVDENGDKRIISIANGKTALIRQPRRSSITGRLLGKDLTKYDYIKAWNNKEKAYELYKNSGRMMTLENKLIFERVSKLGDGYNLKEWTDESIILSNRLDNTKPIQLTQEQQSTKANIQNMIEQSTFSEEQKQGLAKKLGKAIKDGDFGKLLKEICG